MKELLQILLEEGIIKSLLGIAQITLILVPVLIGIELARHFNILEKISAKAQPLLRLLTLPKEAAFPLIVGLGFGIVYGAALIIDYAREGSLNKRDLVLIGIFLSICHAVVEDTIIFVALGANPLILILTRFLMAFIFTRLAAVFIDLRYKKERLHPQKNHAK
ncbi:MAG: nucleoside recognition domain-containing protein [Dethiobacteria bacterium]|jgi:hypothetical protein|nr:nucleoside recognition protein [Bacillota bacterium]